MPEKSTTRQRPLMILPAAGHALRLGQPQAKEMLIHDAAPLIDWSLELATELGFQVVVITRKEKTNLIQHLQSQKVDFLLVDSTQEWPETVLRSKENWREKNLLVLPDTRFSPKRVAADLLENLTERAPLHFAIHRIKDSRQWGVIDHQSRNLRICEKPLESDWPWAWGLIGFRQEAGERLFSALLRSALDHRWQELGDSLQTTELNFFIDLTREATFLKGRS
jgi:dTDP-glucose pyrophosphorylase